jgi:SAM-dependent methyltransferase
LYQRYRPGYPRELVDWIVACAGIAPPASVADVGCGTGISTRLFAERGFDAIGIDPNESMLSFARKGGLGRYLLGEATATGLPDRSVDLVTVGQAFHWFDVPRALAEFRRILRPGGSCAAFWNLRGSSPFLDDYDRVLLAHSSEYEVLRRQGATAETLKNAPGITNAREAEFRYEQRFDLEGLEGRAHSSSYVVHGVADKPAFDRALADLFDRHEQGGSVEFVYRTVAVCWSFNEGATPPPASSAPAPATR